MKKFLILGLLALTASVSLASIKGAPFIPEVDSRFNTLENQQSTNATNITNLQALPANASYTADGLSNMRVLRVTYDFAVNGGATGTINLGQALPAKALIKQVWSYTTTAPLSGGTPAVTLLCEDAANLMASVDLTTYTIGTIHAGVETGVAGTMVAAIAASCNVSMTIATATLTAGKVTWYIEYVITP